MFTAASDRGRNWYAKSTGALQSLEEVRMSEGLVVNEYSRRTYREQNNMVTSFIRRDLLDQFPLAWRPWLDVDFIPVSVVCSNDIYGCQYRGHSGNVDNFSII